MAPSSALTGGSVRRASDHVAKALLIMRSLTVRGTPPGSASTPADGCTTNCGQSPRIPQPTRTHPNQQHTRPAAAPYTDKPPSKRQDG